MHWDFVGICLSGVRLEMKSEKDSSDVLYLWDVTVASATLSSSILTGVGRSCTSCLPPRPNRLPGRQSQKRGLHHRLSLQANQVPPARHLPYVARLFASASPHCTFLHPGIQTWRTECALRVL